MCRGTLLFFWLAPALLFGLFTLWSPQIDLVVSRYFYHPDGFLQQADTQYPFFTWLYKYGNLPGQLVGLSAGLLLLLALWYPALKPWRRGALVVALTSLVGAGILINGIIKEHWNRPRPRQLIEFGGTEKYHPYYSRISKPGDIEFKSFPSGHAAMGFLFLSFGLVGWYERRGTLFIGGMVTGLIFGLILSYARLIQGAHFTSDVLASAMVMWYTALVVCCIVYPLKT